MTSEEKTKWEATKLAVQRIFTEGDHACREMIDHEESWRVEQAFHLGITACQQLIKIGEFDSQSAIGSTNHYNLLRPQDARQLMNDIIGEK